VPVTFRGMGLEEPGDVGVDELFLSHAAARSARTSTHFPDFTTALFERRNTVVQVAVRITFITKSSLNGGWVSASASQSGFRGFKGRLQAQRQRDAVSNGS
jgi:hypothetical protein